jgi:hypothetical protein
MRDVKVFSGVDVFSTDFSTFSALRCMEIRTDKEENVEIKK